jgi:hypothetical protein
VNQSRLFGRYLQEILFRSPVTPFRPAFFDTVFVSSSNVTNLRYLEINEQNYTQYLGNYIYSIEKSNGQCDEQNVTFCVSSVEEIEKCLDLAKVALVRRVGPFIRCLGKFTQDECIDEVAMKRADLINLDPFKFYNATRLVAFEVAFCASFEFNAESLALSGTTDCNLSPRKCVT